MATFPSIFELSSIDGSNGSVLTTNTSLGFNGLAISNAGDINGDGIADIVIGAELASPTDERLNAGQGYVVFGKRGGLDALIDLPSLNGSNGFVINGINRADGTGFSASSAGDINGDGIDDVIIGAPSADLSESRFNAGQSYIIFGKRTGFSSTLEASALDGSNGFIVSGIGTRGDISNNDNAGRAVDGIGDVNGDGIDDLLMTSPGFDPDGRRNAGQSYVVFGKRTGFSSNLSLGSINGSNGFKINGIAENDRIGGSVSSLGDFNNDGISDFIIGAGGASPDGKDRAGQSYVIFGKRTGFGSALELSDLNGSNGFKVNGANALNRAGTAVSGAGDINADGIDDLIIGSPTNVGRSYVVFGRSGSFGSEFDLGDINGSNGFVINGGTFISRSGESVGEAGDINGDGIDDVVIGAPSSRTSGGEVFVVYGQSTGFGESLALNDLNGSNGFRLQGELVSDEAGYSVSGAGDVNADGIDDLLIGEGFFASRADKQGYVVYGRSSRPTVQGKPATAYVNSSNQIVGNAFFAGQTYQGALYSNTDDTGNTSDVMLGTSNGDNIWAGTQGDDLIDAGAGSDLLGIGNGNVTAFTGEGDDFVYAIGRGAGNNNVSLGNGTNNFYAQAGNNTVSAGSDSDIIGLGTGQDVVNAGDGNNIIYMIEPSQRSARKTVTAGIGQDYIQTGSGDDLLSGGRGLNSLYGGQGRDTFVARADAYNFIGDFEFGSDRIKIEGVSFGQLSFFQGNQQAGNASTTYIFANNFGIGEVANSTVAALDNAANFV